MNDSAKKSFHQRQIRDLIEARFENNLDDAGLEELGEYLQNDSVALNEYVAQATLWSDLRVLAKNREDQAVVRTNEHNSPIVSLRHIVAFSTAIAASIAAFFFFQKEPSEENSSNGDTTNPIVVSSKHTKEKTDLKSIAGSTEGILVDKGKSDKLGSWIDIRPDEGKGIGEILVPDELADSFSSLFTSNRLLIKWTKTAEATYPTATSIQNLRPKEDEGTVNGTVVTKQDDKWIEIQSTEGTIRRYVPRWTGRHPTQGGGLDIVGKKLIKEAKLGSKVQVEWIWDERVRLVNLLLLD